MTNQERMAKVAWLSRYRTIERQIKRLKEDKEHWQDKATNIVPTPVHFKYYDHNKPADQPTIANMTIEDIRRNNMLPVVVHGSSGGLGIDDCIAEISEIQCQIQEKIKNQIKAKCEIEKAIEDVPDEKLSLLLEYKYIDGLRLEEIACEMKYAYRTVKRLHNKGLELINVVPQCPLEMC